MKKHMLKTEMMWEIGKHAVITGGSSGIGFEVARRLNGVCKKISLIARNENGKLSEAKEALLRLQKDERHGIRTEICTYPMDVRNIEAAQVWVGEVYAKKRDQVDIFVNSAGGSHIYGTLEQMSMSDINAIFDVNAKAPIMWMRALLPYMKRNKMNRRDTKRGHVLMLSSRSGERTLPKLSVYTAAKGALEKLVEAMQKEYAQYRIVFTLINPGSVNTDFTGHWEASTRKAHNEESMTVREAAEPILQAIHARVAINKISYESVNQWLNEPGVLLEH
jgi:3-oxoacyl-[acyl-carrier protein] reductase